MLRHHTGYRPLPHDGGHTGGLQGLTATGLERAGQGSPASTQGSAPARGWEAHYLFPARGRQGLALHIATRSSTAVPRILMQGRP